MPRYPIRRTLGFVLLFLLGCGPGTRYDIVTIAPADEEHSKTPPGHRWGSWPVVYFWNGGARIIGTSLLDPGTASGRWRLKGKLGAQTFTAFRPSRVVRVEAVDNEHRLLWVGTARLKRDRGTVRRRSRSGTFQLELPMIPGLDHLHVGIVAQNDASDMLPGTCLRADS